MQARNDTRADLAPRVLDFCRVLRESGFRLTPAHSTAALQALRLVDVGDREDFHLALRSVLASGQPDLEPFDRLFELFWEAKLRIEPRDLLVEEPEAAVRASESTARYSAMELLAARDFSEFQTADDVAALERALAQLARRLASRPSRRFQPARHGGRVDLRRTMRHSLRLGGTAIELVRRRREIRKTKLVLICDVSRSMDQYSRFLLHFIYAFQRALGRVESFVFATRLTRVTRYFRTSSIQQALEYISHDVLDWSGGTRIGGCLETFNREYRSVVGSGTTVVVLSDGLDTGNLDLLDAQMAILRRRARRLIWLNPLLGNEPNEGLARGMLRALPYVDTFAAAHNLASLEILARQL